MTNFTTQYGALGNRSDDFSYNGTLDFATYNYNDSTTVASWLSSGTGSAVGLAAGLGGAQMSKPDINSGTATTTFFLFTLLDSLGSSDFAIKHDDGVGVFENGSLLGGFLGPNGVRTTNVSGYHGGTLQFLYVATNGDPSVFKVNATTVPVPAALPLLVGGLGMMGFVARRKRSASKA